MGDRYQPSKGLIVKYDPKTVGKGYIYTQYAWYPAREAPLVVALKRSFAKGYVDNKDSQTNAQRRNDS